MVVAVSLIPMFGIMSTGNKTSSQGEALVQASAICRNVMDALLNDVPFKSLLPGGVTYDVAKSQYFNSTNATTMKTGGAVGAGSINGAIGSGGDGTIFNTGFTGSNTPLIVEKNGSAFQASTKYLNGVLHQNTNWCVKDERGNYYYINVCVRVVPVLFRYLGADSNSKQDGNIQDSTGTSKCWKVFYAPDYTTSPTIDYVFGDEKIASNAGPLDAWYPNDVPDSRLKKIVVSIFWIDRQKGGNKVQSFSLIAFKAKLED
jgi:hypothetical protein